MAAAKKPAETAKEEGTLYIRSDGQTFKAPKINATEIGKIIENKYIKQGLDQMQMVVFQDDPVARIKNKDKETDADLTAQLNDMINEKNVAFSFAMQRRWRDVMEWGPATTNPYWDYGMLDEVTGDLIPTSEYRLLKLNRLPPSSFAKKGGVTTLVYNRLLPGICINEKTGKEEFWQTQRNGQVIHLTNVQMTTNPLTGELGGVPYIWPVFPFVKMLNYAWQRQMQKVNIWGSGGLWFIKVTDPIGDDQAFAQKIVKNQSSINRYQLRQNMEIINLGIAGDGSALETITELGMQLRQFFIPSDLGKDGGQLIGGSNAAEFKKYVSFLKGNHRWLEWDAYLLLRPWLVYNGYEEKGYRLVIDIPTPELDKSELWLKVAGEGRQGQSITENEHRALLSRAIGDESILAPLDDAQLSALRERNAALNQIAFGAQLQKAEIVTKAAAAGITNKSGARSFLQATLGIEEGEPEEDLGRDQERRAVLKLANAAEDLAAEKKKERA